jgi:GNAT superfamily N-acetyltransferase
VWGFVCTSMGEPAPAARYRVRVRIETISPTLHAALGELTVAAYRGLPGRPTSDRYAAMLRDVPSRARDAEVLVALGDDGALLGGVTYVGDPASDWAEFDVDDEACFRMLAVAAEARGRGAGRALVEACIERARRDGKARLSLMTTPNMEPAHRLYERMGFRRRPASDVIVEDGLQLRSYVLELDGGA